MRVYAELRGDRTKAVAALGERSTGIAGNGGGCLEAVAMMISDLETLAMGAALAVSVRVILKTLGVWP